ncbi:hypothetical protein QC761_0106920 [Podospora bellae-mahoneyi]|uniref:Uncharacterized protein n=1 Tax=Podospora bellae-mahoneyi TaxID=2093777 RepID=A0ABR0F891_9PEZI|nr:hypothetical protein QC761_0106920 [Podospora bellae-mahoneyi]
MSRQVRLGRAAAWADMSVYNSREEGMMDFLVSIIRSSSVPVRCKMVAYTLQLIDSIVSNSRKTISRILTEASPLDRHGRPFNLNSNESWLQSPFSK